jgi:hypothetical protein
MREVLDHWQKVDGSTFRCRQLLLGWGNVPLHPGAESQVLSGLFVLLDHDAILDNMEGPA